MAEGVIKGGDSMVYKPMLSGRADSVRDLNWNDKLAPVIKHLDMEACKGFGSKAL